MRQLQRNICVVVAVMVAGCGVGGNTISIGFSPTLAPIPPGERAEAGITVRFSDDTGPWANRRVTVAIRSPKDVTVEPAESEVTLDEHGSASVRVSIIPDQAAPPGPRTLTVTATGSETASSTLNVEFAVR